MPLPISPILILGGPTASGKSALALAIAKEMDAVIINADSMQLYAPFPVLSAQPSPEDRVEAPHALYGILPPEERCSAGKWVELAKEAITSAHQAGKLPIVVGGTGLYLKTLIYGIAPIPDIEDSYRQEAAKMLARLGNAAFHQHLSTLDSAVAAKLAPGDSQRMVRAYEVIRQTGISLLEWQKEAHVTYFPKGAFCSFFLNPERSTLYQRCDARFTLMAENGGLEEAKNALEAGLPADLPCMHTLGIKELMAYLRGTLSMEEAVTLAQTATRHYAKRQVTWFRHQLPEATELGIEVTGYYNKIIIETVKKTVIALS